jgi:hypothetical protein
VDLISKKKILWVEIECRPLLVRHLSHESDLSHSIFINCSTFRSSDGFELNNVEAGNSVVLVVEVGMSQVPLGVCN